MRMGKSLIAKTSWSPGKIIPIMMNAKNLLHGWSNFGEWSSVFCHYHMFNVKRRFFLIWIRSNLCVCVCVCVCVCMCVCVCVRTCPSLIHKHTHTHIWVCLCLWPSMHQMISTLKRFHGDNDLRLWSVWEIE